MPGITEESIKFLSSKIRQIAEDLRDGKATKEEYTLVNEEMAEAMKDAQILFESEENYQDFSIAIDRGFQVDHELKHSIPYRKAKVDYFLGWYKIISSLGTIHLPFCVPHGKVWESFSLQERDFLRYASLLAVSDPSDKDEIDIVALKARYGEEINSPEKNKFLA